VEIRRVVQIARVVPYRFTYCIKRSNTRHLPPASSSVDHRLLSITRCRLGLNHERRERKSTLRVSQGNVFSLSVAPILISSVRPRSNGSKDSRNKLPDPRRRFWIRLPSPAARALPRAPIKGYMSPTTSALNSRCIIRRNRSPHLQIDMAAALAEALICGDQSQEGSGNRSFPSR